MYAHLSRLLAVAAAALYMSITAAGSASAATTNVDTQSLAGPCSDSRTALEAEDPTTPWCSLSKALTASPDGSSIVVRRGTYPATAVSGRHLVTGITVGPFPGEQPAVTSLSVKQSDRFAISGLKLQSVLLDTTRSISLTGNEITPGGVNALAPTGLLVSGNVFHDGTDGLIVNRGSDVSVLGNTFRDMPRRTNAGGDGIQGAYITGLTVRGNTFLRIANPLGHSDAIELLATNDFVTIDGNLFRATRGPIVTGGTGVTGKYTRHLVVTNNEMTQTPGWALNFTTTPGATVVNNTVWAAAHGIMLNGGSTRVTLYNNIVSRLEAAKYTVVADDYNLIAVGPMKGLHDKRGDPRFVSQTLPDYHLTAVSPAVDAGWDAQAPLLDRDGLPRIGAPDLGAYELQR
jgi:hypothetical protein